MLNLDSDNHGFNLTIQFLNTNMNKKDNPGVVFCTPQNNEQQKACQIMAVRRGARLGKSDLPRPPTVVSFK
jgi:hypothetical protein